MVSLNQIDAILLAAGASKRLGEPKALVDIHGKSLIEILIKKLKKNNLRVIIVTRKDLVIEMEKLGEKVVVNMKPEDGRTGSIQCGIKELESERCLIVPVDRPGFSNETIEKLIHLASNSSKRIELEDEIAKRAGLDEGYVAIDVPSVKLLLSEPRMSQVDIRIIGDDGKTRWFKDHTPIAEALRNRQVSQEVVYVMTLPGYEKIVERLADEHIFS